MSEGVGKGLISLGSGLLFIISGSGSGFSRIGSLGSGFGLGFGIGNGIGSIGSGFGFGDGLNC